MKKFVLSMMLAASSMTMTVAIPAAAQQTPAPVATAPAPAAPPAEGVNVSALGGGIALIVVGFAGYFIARSRRRKSEAANEPVFTAKQAAAPVAPAAPKAPVAPAAPVFDSAAFLSHAKASFIRMQAAWDKADTNDLKQFTTPEVFSELSAQIGNRGETASVTEVVQIDAELLGVQAMGEDELASVKFTGMIKPDATAPAEPFAEVWNMSRARTAKGAWVLAGIQQLS